MSHNGVFWNEITGNDLVVSQRQIEPFELFEFVSDFRIKSSAPIKICSKNFPVIHLPHEEDEVLETLLPFRYVIPFKESWPGMNLTCYFGMTKQLYSEIGKIDFYFVRHYSSILNEFWLDDPSVFHVDFENNYMHVYCKMEGQFLFYNRLIFKNEADVHYNLMYVRQEVFKCDKYPDLTFSGQIDKKSKIWKTLESYFPKMSLINDNQSDFTYNSRVLSPQYFDIYANALCGL